MIIYILYVAKRAMPSKQNLKSKSNKVSSDYQDTTSLSDISDDLADDVDPSESVEGSYS